MNETNELTPYNETTCYSCLLVNKDSNTMIYSGEGHDSAVVKY